MNIYTSCNHCKKEIRYFIWASDRVQLSMEKGKLIELTCKYCGTRKKYHLNSFYAKENKLALIIALILFLCGTPIVLYTIPILIKN